MMLGEARREYVKREKGGKRRRGETRRSITSVLEGVEVAGQMVMMRLGKISQSGQ